MAISPHPVSGDPMQSYPPRKILGRPALHVVIALCFAAAFCWPIFVLDRPTQTFHFLYAAWLLSLVALFAIGRAPVREEAAAAREDGEPRAVGAAGRGETR
jgi:hypothetical protein